MSRNVSTYDHFCVIARALEGVGGRWTLLIVRDLLSGTKRFTDLVERLGAITPTTLTQRLRELENTGIVAVDREAGRREVWYCLTPAGEELRPVIDALGWWGARHAWRWPLENEPLHADHLLRAAAQAIDMTTDVRDTTLWHFRIDGDDYTIRGGSDGWTHAAAVPTTPADVTITATTDSLKRLILGESDAEVVMDGGAQQIRRFRELITALAKVAPSLPAA
jgi:DNA-binding HxlR family transcriptional regulator